MRTKNLFKSYLRDTSGNFAMMFGLMSIPLLIAVGMAVDINRLQSFDNKLQDAVDAAAIYAAIIPDDINDDDDDDDDDDGNNHNSDYKAKVREVFEDNLIVDDVRISDFEVVPSNDGSVSIMARAHIPAMFTQIGGFPRMNTVASTNADADAGSDLEVVIAFDITNSMGFDSTWTTAMGTLDNVLTELDQYTGTDNFYVSLVPFSDRVNIGTSNSGWISGSSPSVWNGCAEPREVNNGTVTWALDDKKPNGADKFDASIPGVTGGLATRGAGYPHCPNVAITGPTNSVSDIISAANGFTKSGTGRFDVGMAWAWRMLAKNWRTEFAGMPNSFAQDKKRRQIAILVTDGRTNAYDYEVGANNSWGWNEGSVEGFENLVTICNGMKDEDMEIFTIRIDGNTHATSYMQDCASTNDHYFEITSNADLETALIDVLKIVKANVRLTN